MGINEKNFCPKLLLTEVPQKIHVAQVTKLATPICDHYRNS